MIKFCTEAYLYGNQRKEFQAPFGSFVQIPGSLNTGTQDKNTVYLPCNYMILNLIIKRTTVATYTKCTYRKEVHCKIKQLLK